MRERESTGLAGDMLEVHDSERTDGTRWRLVIPNVPEVKKRIMEELHSVPYSGHLGIPEDA